MMEVKDLRIGNYLVAADGILCEVITLEKEGYKTEPVKPIQIEPIFQSGEVIKPRLQIPLTEEWLKRFGAKENILYIIDNMWLQFEDGEWSVCNDSDELYDIPSIKHVHQLQNLYFALTGEELKLKQ